MPPDYTPPGDIPSNILFHNSSSNDVPRNILAFRTITAILAQLQPKQEFKDSESYRQPELSPMDRQAVRISDALANLAITEHDVVALATERTSRNLTVLAYASTIPKEETTPNKESPKEERPFLFRFLFTKNFRRKETAPIPSITYPIIVDAMKPEGMGSLMLPEYLENLEGGW